MVHEKIDEGCMEICVGGKVKSSVRYTVMSKRKEAAIVQDSKSFAAVAIQENNSSEV